MNKQELKDVEWLKEEVNKTLRNKVADGINYYDYIDLKNSLNEILNQLDEPEVLSQEFIDEKAVEIYSDTADAEIHAAFRMRDLQNLIVPKQELPVIPKFVAEWISVHHERFDLYPALKRLESNALSWEDVYEWYRRNTHTFANAYLTGKYEVEEEQKYVVELPNPNSQMGRHKNVFLNKKEGKVFIDSASLFVNDITKYGQFALTEEEIKEEFEWAWKFAKEVDTND